MFGKSIGSQEGRTADREPGIQYLPAPFCWRAFRQRRIAPSELEKDAAAQAAFVELERGLAPSIKPQTDIKVPTLITSSFREPSFAGPRLGVLEKWKLVDDQVQGVQPAREFHSSVICA